MNTDKNYWPRIYTNKIKIIFTRRHKDTEVMGHDGQIIWGLQEKELGDKLWLQQG